MNSLCATQATGGSSSEGPSRLISVAIFEDDRMTCHGLRDQLDTAPGFRCVLAALSLRNAVKRVAEANPDLVILDIHFPSGSGLAALAAIKKSRPDQRVLMHTAMDSGDEILLAYLLGASGYLLKGDGRCQLLAAVEVVTDGGAIFSPKIAWMFRQLTMGNHPTGWVLELTPAEIDVLQWLAQGQTAKEIAAERNTGIKTVNKQCEAIRKKAQTHNMRRALAQLGPWTRILAKFRDLWSC